MRETPLERRARRNARAIVFLAAGVGTGRLASYLDKRRPREEREYDDVTLARKVQTELLRPRMRRRTA